MGTFHLLLGRLWQYDRRVTYDDHANTYSFKFNNIKIVILPSKDFGKPKPTGDCINLLSLARFEKEMRDTCTSYVLIGKEVSDEVQIPEATVSLVKEFGMCFWKSCQRGYHLYGNPTLD